MSSFQGRPPQIPLQVNTVYSLHSPSIQGHVLCLPELSLKIYFLCFIKIDEMGMGSPTANTSCRISMILDNKPQQQLTPGYEKHACRFVWFGMYGMPFPYNKMCIWKRILRGCLCCFHVEKWQSQQLMNVSHKFSHPVAMSFVSLCKQATSQMNATCCHTAAPQKAADVGLPLAPFGSFDCCLPTCCLSSSFCQCAQNNVISGETFHCEPKSIWTPQTGSVASWLAYYWLIIKKKWIKNLNTE